MRKRLLLFTLCLLASAGWLGAQLPTTCPNANNQCLQFDGLNDYVEMATPGFTNTGPFTMEARFTCDVSSAITRRLFSLASSATNRFDVVVVNGKLRVFWNNLVTGDISTSVVSNNGWHHFAAARSGNTLQCYLDGVTLTPITLDNASPTISAFRLGAQTYSNPTTSAWWGKIDEVRVWNVARTAAQITANMSCQVSCTNSSLVDYYRFDQNNNPGGTNTGGSANSNTLIDCTAQPNNSSAFNTRFALTGSASNWVCGEETNFVNTVCGTTCAAAFTFAQTNCGVVTFTNTTPVPNGFSSYTWAFGDGTTSTGTTPAPHTYALSGPYTVCLTGSSTGAGSCSTCQTIQVTNISTPPTITCPSNQTVACNGTLQSPSPTVGHSICASQTGQTLSCLRGDGQALTAPYPAGLTTVTCTATDNLGSTSCTYTVTGVDNQAPTLSCQDVFFFMDNSGVTAFLLQASEVVQSVSDNCCPTNSLTYNLAGQTVYTCDDACSGPKTVMLSVTDCAGNSRTCTALVFVQDNVAPLAKCKPAMVNVTSSGSVVMPPSAIDNGSIDNCGNLGLSVTPNTFSCDQVCKQPVLAVLTVTDCSGNTATCTALVTVKDLLPPTLICPANRTVTTAQGLCSQVINQFAATATDNCPGLSVISYQSSAGNGVGAVNGLSCNVGTTLFTFSATDGCGNTGTCTATVTVRDLEPPVIVCPANQTFTCNPVTGTATITPAGPVTLTDNCPGVTYQPSVPPPTQLACNTSAAITYVATDASGNTAICSFQVHAGGIPPNCMCGSFSNLSYGQPGGLASSVVCGDLRRLPCPVGDKTFEIKGSFACASNPPSVACTPSNMTWVLTNSGGTTVASGTMASSSFTIVLAGSLMSAAGTYQLTLGADCGQTSCARCVISLVVDCPCPNRALDFDGVDDQVSLAPSPVTGNSDFTAEVVFTCTATGGGTGCGSNFRRLLALSGPGSRFEVGECGGILNIYWYDGTSSFGPTQIAPNLNVRDGVCRHLAAVRSGDNVEVFLNGVSIFTGAGVNPQNINLFRLGQWGGTLAPGENWQGTMDEVRLWNYPRTAVQINEFRNCPLTGSEAGLMVYWPMDQGIPTGNNPTVTQALDATAGLDQGLLSNFALTGMHSNWVCGCSGFGEGCSKLDTLCGKAVVTCFPGYTAAGVLNTASPAFGIVDIRDRSLASLGAYWSAASGANIHHPAHWNATNVGLVFGIAIDKQHNFYLSSTTVYGCPSTSFNPFGPAGAAGIYRVDPSDVITPFITTGAFNTSGTGTTIPNSGSGLGNLCYDPDHDQLFVTNFSDGMIYRIKGGLVVDRFDPFTTTNPVSTDNPNFVALSERPWGIAYSKVDKRVYFSRWREDRGRPNSSIYNEIWSVGLTGAGGFSGVCSGGTCSGGDVKEFDVPDHVDTYGGISQSYSNPVSDIAFSDKGLMLIAERSMRADCGDASKTFPNWPTWYSHQARVLEYEKVGVWNLTAGHATPPFTNYASELKFKVGGPYVIYPNFFANSSGGVDYGYDSFKEAPKACDNSVWMTADYMSIAGGPYYGLQGNLASGGGVTNGFLVDYDGIPGTKDKLVQGDVEVFKCLSCLETPPCDSIKAAAKPAKQTPTDKSCCYNLNISNLATSPIFSGIHIQMISGGSLSVTPQSGWSINSFITGVAYGLEHSSGSIPTGGSIPARICFSNLTDDEQVIAIQYLDPNGEVYESCTDTLRLKCDYCISIVNDTIKCDPAHPGQRTMKFCIKVPITLPWNVNSVVLTSHTPGVTLSPSSFSVPNVLPGAPPYCIPGTVSITVAPGFNPIHICIGFTVHEADVTQGLPPLNCCMIEDCFDLPDCCPNYATATATEPINGKCCWNITLHQPAGTAPFVTTSIIPSGSPVTFYSISSSAGWNFSGDLVQNVTWQTNPSGTLPAIATLPKVCFDVPAGSPSPQEMEIVWSTKEEILCRDTLRFNCKADTNCAIVDSVRIVCGQPLPSNNLYTIKVTNVSGYTVTNIGVVYITPAGSVLTNIFPVAPMLPGDMRFITIPMVGGPANTKVCFKINLYRQTLPGVYVECCVTDIFHCVRLNNCGMINGPQSIAIYPNPTRGNVTLAFGDEGSPVNGWVRIRDMAGRLLREEEVPAGSLTHEVQMPDLASGLYLAEFVENGTRVSAQKISVIR